MMRHLFAEKFSSEIRWPPARIGKLIVTLDHQDAVHLSERADGAAGIAPRLRFDDVRNDLDDIVELLLARLDG